MSTKRTIYLICLENPAPDVLRAIRTTWPNSHFVLNDTQAFIAEDESAGIVVSKSVYDRLAAAVGGSVTGFVMPVSSYFGHQDPRLWEWLGRAQAGW